MDDTQHHDPIRFHPIKDQIVTMHTAANALPLVARCERVAVRVISKPERG